MRKVTQFSPEVFKKINQTFFDFFYEKQRACGLDDISSATSLPKSKVSEYLQIMLKRRQIHEIFSGKGQPTLYIPAGAIRDMMKLEPKPKWVEKFEFKEKVEINEKIKIAKTEIEKYDSFERILFTHDKVLEKSLAIVLEFLGFEKIIYTEDPQKHDIEFYFDKCYYIVEVKGKSGQADKDDVLQLRGWIDLKLEEGVNAEFLKGILIVNNHRHIEPSKRTQEPFTEKAKQYLKMNKFVYISTRCIFEIVKQVVESKIDASSARKMFLNGELVP